MAATVAAAWVTPVVIKSKTKACSGSAAAAADPTEELTVEHLSLQVATASSGAAAAAVTAPAGSSRWVSPSIRRAATAGSAAAAGVGGRVMLAVPEATAATADSAAAAAAAGITASAGHGGSFGGDGSGVSGGGGAGLGGAIFNYAGTVSITNSTIAYNCGHRRCRGKPRHRGGRRTVQSQWQHHDHQQHLLPEHVGRGRPRHLQSRLHRRDPGHPRRSTTRSSAPGRYLRSGLHRLRRWRHQ